MTTIDPGMYLSNRPSATNQTGQNMLGKDDFLKLLMVQLQNQDPSNPMDDKEFIAQMATFSSLEQMTNMNQSIQRFVNLQTSQSLVQHSELIGKKVQWSREVQIDDYRTKTEYADNQVSSVKLEKDGTLRFLLDNGRWISNNQIVQISIADNPSATPPSDNSEANEE